MVDQTFSNISPDGFTIMSQNINRLRENRYFFSVLNSLDELSDIIVLSAL